MNEQEKTLQGIIEFCQWLIPNAKQLGLEQSKSIAMIKQAQTPNDIMNGMNSLYQELGEEQFTALAQAFQQSKSQNIKMAKKGAKIDYLVDKFQGGGPVRHIRYDDRGRTVSRGEEDDRRRREDAMKNARIHMLNDNGYGVVDLVETDGSRVERSIGNYGTPQADTSYVYYPNASTSPRIDIYDNNAIYTDIYGGYRVIPTDSINHYRRMLDKKITNRYQNGGELPKKYTYVKYDDRGRMIPFSEREERARRVNDVKDLRDETINDDGHFISDRIDFGPVRIYRNVHNWNLSSPDTAYFYDFGNGHRIGIDEAGRGTHFMANGEYRSINNNMAALLKRIANKKINR